MQTQIEIAVKEKPSSGVSMNTLEQGIYLMTYWGSRGGSSDERPKILVVINWGGEKRAMAFEPDTSYLKPDSFPVLHWTPAIMKQNQNNGDRGYFTPITNLRIEATIGNEEHSF